MGRFGILSQLTAAVIPVCCHLVSIFSGFLDQICFVSFPSDISVYGDLTLFRVLKSNPGRPNQAVNLVFAKKIFYVSVVDDKIKLLLWALVDFNPVWTLPPCSPVAWTTYIAACPRQ